MKDFFKNLQLTISPDSFSIESQSTFIPDTASITTTKNNGKSKFNGLKMSIYIENNFSINHHFFLRIA